MTVSFRPREYFRLQGMDEAIGVLLKFGSKAKIIAGGTDLLVQKPNDVECLIDISALDLDYIKKEKGCIYIGAGTAINLQDHYRYRRQRTRTTELRGPDRYSVGLPAGKSRLPTE